MKRPISDIIVILALVLSACSGGVSDPPPAAGQETPAGRDATDVSLVDAVSDAPPGAGQEAPVARDATDVTFTDVVAGQWHVCGLLSDGRVVCWGANFFGEADAPAGEFRAVSAGSGLSCGVRVDGTVTCWGSNRYGEADAPAGEFRAVSAGSSHSCGIRVDGTVTCWGESYSRVTEPRGRFDAVSAGEEFSCGLRVEATITCWGDDDHGRATPPEGRFRSVSAGFLHACGLGVDGEITCWGDGNVEFPRWVAGRFSAVTASWGWHGCGVRVDDGTIKCWGYGWYGQTRVPKGQFRDVAAGELFSCGLRTDGTIICWGTNDRGPLNMPEGAIEALPVVEPADVPEPLPPTPPQFLAVERFTHEFDWGTFTLAEHTARELIEERPMTIAVGVNGTDVGLFSGAVRTGVERACEAAQSRLRVICTPVGPLPPDRGEHFRTLRDLLGAGRVDCLAIQSHTPGASIDSINDFVDAGVPVFTFHDDIANSKRFAFFGMDQISAGAANGRVTAELAQQRGLDVNVVAVGSDAHSSGWAAQRIEGFIQGFTEALPDTTFLNDQTNVLPTSPKLTTQEGVDTIGSFLTANSDVNLFFHTDYGLERVGQVITNQDKVGDIWAAGFSVSDPILDLIDQDVILVTIDAGADNQAAAAVTACVDLLADGKLPASDLPQIEPIIITRDSGDGRITTTEARQRLNQFSP